MSNFSNEELLTRAYELLEESTGMSWIDKAIQNAIDRNDLEELRGLVNKLEHELSVSHFHNTEQVKEFEDIY